MTIREKRRMVDGQHAVLLEDEDGSFQGELVWRLANIGQGIAEITGLGIENPARRRQGWGTHLPTIAIDDIRTFIRASRATG